MTGSSLLNENVNGISDECFEDIIKFFDFPLEDVEENVGEEDWNTKLDWFDPPSLDVLADLSRGFSGQICNDASKIPQNLSALDYKISPLKELPVTGEATSSRSDLLRKSSDEKGFRLFQTSSPVSVLESSSSCSVENPATFDLKIIVPLKRARSKRQCRPNFNWHFLNALLSVAPKISHPSAACESGSETNPNESLSPHLRRKMRKKKNLAVLSGATETRNYSSQGPGSTRKCMHCEVTKTPQWREGPMGPKTLCNACGVRYRSGRLFPEYRPVASPTFVASLHSNSHKKVVEMRSKPSPGARMCDMVNVSSLVQGVLNA